MTYFSVLAHKLCIHAKNGWPKMQHISYEHYTSDPVFFSV